MLELHVWGPAFDLPSIDPHCLAAIAYLKQAVPLGQWVVIASSNPTLSPTHELPALRDGNLWIGGFRNIFHYLAQHSSGKWILDVGLSEQEGADCIAFSSFLDYTAQPLLDLSLYVSRENYSKVTRPAYSNLQPFPLPYLTPDAIRSSAQTRTQNLGLTSFIVNNSSVSENVSSSSLDSILPENLRRSKQTVSSLLSASPESKAQIRLDSLASSFFEHIETLRAKKRYLVSDTQITSLDCLALGYLSLMLIPELPQSWLAMTMRRKFPRLSAWTQELRTEIFGGALGRQDILSDTNHGDLGGILPWQKPESQSMWSRGQLFFLAIIDSTPGLRHFKRKDKMKYRGGDISNNNKDSEVSNEILITVSSILLTAVTASIGMTLWGRSQATRCGNKEEYHVTDGLSTFDDAGTILGAYVQHPESILL